MGSFQVPPDQVRPLQVRAREVGPFQVGPFQVRPCQVGPFQVRLPQVGITEIASTGNLWIPPSVPFQPFRVGRERGREVLNRSPLRIWASINLVGLGSRDDQQKDKPDNGSEERHDGTIQSVQ